MALHVEDYLRGAAAVPDRKFTQLFGLFPVQVKFSHHVYGFSHNYHGPFKVVVERGGKFHMLISPFTEDTLRQLRWRDAG